MASIEQMEEQIIHEFQQMESVDEKYATLFRIGDSLPEMDPGLKTEHNRVKDCQSTVWFHLRTDDEGRCYLSADSDSMVIKGITALLARLIAGHKPDELISISMNFLNQIEIWKLPSQRNSGLMAMLDHIKTDARQIMNEIRDRGSGDEHP